MLDNTNTPKFNKKPMQARHNGHESVLHTFAKSGIKITIATVDGFFFEGKIRAYDKYTISLQDEKNRIRIFFKSAISYFVGCGAEELPEFHEAN